MFAMFVSERKIPVKLPYFSHPIAFDLTVLRDRVSDCDEFFARNRPIMELHDPADAIDLARSGLIRKFK